MRGDAGVGGDEQRLSQIVWILFLKIFDYKEEEWELTQDNYAPIIPIGYRWRDWVTSSSVKDQMTGEELIDLLITSYLGYCQAMLLRMKKEKMYTFLQGQTEHP